MKKKIMGILLSITMVASLTVGCGSTTSDTNETSSTKESSTGDAASSDENKETASTNASGDKIKIGVSIWSTTDSLGGSCKKILDAAAEAVGCDIEYVETGLESDKVVSSIENLCASGCNGIIVCNSSDGELPPMINTCEEYNVKLAQFFRTISDEETIKLAENSTSYVGQTHEDEYTTGQNMAEIMAKKGCKNVGILSQTHGNMTYETRCNGYLDKFKELGITVVAEQWDVITAEDAASTVNNFLASYPEIDGVVVVGGGGEPLDGAINAIENNGKTGKIAVCSTDFTSTLGDQLADGAISSMSGGHWTDPMFSFLMVYNAINGAYDEEGIIEIDHPMMYVSSAEDYKDYETYFTGKFLPYTAEEIQNLVITHNPDTTLDDLKNAAASLSIEDVKERHADLIQ